MSKRPSLFAAKTDKPAPDPLIVADTVAIAEVQQSPTAAKIRPPSREGKRVLSVYLKPEAWKQLKMLSLNLENSTQSLGEEAVNLLFEKHRLNRIA